MKKTALKFATEADLCKAFLSCVGSDWTAYNETGNFDILLVHKSGVQIGVEAKLTLNGKVLAQALEGLNRDQGPDFRAVLVGRVVAENAILANALGITVITLKAKQRNNRHYRWQGPDRTEYELCWGCALPEFTDYSPLKSPWLDREHWYDRAPIQRLTLPDYVPDVEAGHPSPQCLSQWKIQAIKACVHCRKVGRVNRSDFKALKINPSRWMNGHWMQRGVERGYWVPGPSFPEAAYRQQHPAIYERIEADYPKWSVDEGLVQASEQAGLAL